MQSQLESERLSVRTNHISTDRPDSSQLVDLHIYIIPKNIWKDRQNLAENEAMEQAISAGFVRVPQNLTIHELREHIFNICGQDDEFPKEFIYLRSVGRCLTKVRPQQETDLRVKNYRPPTTFAPEIYVLEGHHEDEPLTSNSKSYLFRESPIQQPLTTPPPQSNTNRHQSWVKPNAVPPPLTTYPSSVHSNERQKSINFNGPVIDSFSNLSSASSTLSARDLAKLREEQERLRLRQIELARQRREIEQEQQRREKELIEKQENVSKEQREKEEVAAIRIQATYRGYRHRRKTEKQQQEQQRKLAANEIERLQKEARELTRRKAEEEHAEEIEAHDVAKLSDRLEELIGKRAESEVTREAIVRRMQQFHAQISVRRKEERDLWKQKYLIEKKKTTALEEQIQMTSKDQPDIKSQVEQAQIRLNHSTKLRQQAQKECQLLKQELQQIRANINTLQKNSLLKQPPPPQKQQQQPQQQPQQQQPTIPISLDITLQY